MPEVVNSGSDSIRVKSFPSGVRIKLRVVGLSEAAAAAASAAAASTSATAAAASASAAAASATEAANTLVNAVRVDTSQAFSSPQQSQARTNIGLGTMATQAASSVAITGGTAADVAISNPTITSGSLSSTTVSSAVATATGGATSRSLAAHLSNVVWAADFGVDLTGATNSSTAFDSFVEYVINNNKRGKIGAGTVLLNSRVSVTAASPTWASIEGEGEDVTILLGGAANTTGLLDINLTATSAVHGSFSLSKVGFRPGARSAGTALKVTSTGSTGALKGRVVDLDRVRIMPERNEDAFFDTGIWINNCGRCHLGHIRISGLWGPDFDPAPLTVESFDNTGDTVTITAHDFIEYEKITYSDGGGTAPTGLTDGDTYFARTITANTFQLSSTPYGSVIDFTTDGVGSAHTFTKEDFSDSAEEYQMGTAILIEDTYFPELDDIHCTRASRSIDVTGDTQEAMFLKRFVASTQDGIRWLRTGGKQPTVWIKDGHIHYRDWGLWLQGIRYFWVESVDFQQSIPADYHSATPRDVVLLEALNGHFNNTTHNHTESNDARVGFSMTGTDLGTITITSPHIEAKMATFLSLASGSPTNITCLNPIFGSLSSVATKFSDSTGVLRVIGMNAVQELSGAGAINLFTPVTALTTTGTNALTLADGTEGQRKTIVMVADGGDGTLTPTSFGNGTTITFAEVGDSVDLVFLDGEWWIAANNGAAVA